MANRIVEEWYVDIMSSDLETVIPVVVRVYADDDAHITSIEIKNIHDGLCHQGKKKADYYGV